MIVKLLTEHHLESLSLKGGCTGSFELTHVKMPHCWKSHVSSLLKVVVKYISIYTAQLYRRFKQHIYHQLGDFVHCIFCSIDTFTLYTFKIVKPKLQRCMALHSFKSPGSKFKVFTYMYNVYFQSMPLVVFVIKWLNYFLWPFPSYYLFKWDSCQLLVTVLLYSFLDTHSHRDLNLFMLMDFPIHIDTIIMGLSILLFFSGHRSKFLNYKVFLH